MGTPVRYPFGVSTRVKGSGMGNYPMPDPFNSGSLPTLGVAEYANDFTGLGNIAELTVTGASSALALSASAEGGQAVLTPGGTTTASSAYVTNGSFKFVAGQQAWFEARVKASAVAGNVAYKVGLQYQSAVTDGLWFVKAAASTALKVTSAVNNTSTDILTALSTEAADTWKVYGFYYDGVDLYAFVDKVLVGRYAAATIGATNTYVLTNKVLSPVIQITPTATDTLTADYILAASEVLR